MCLENLAVHSRIAAAPLPALRLWLYLATSRPSGFSGTPSMLYEEMSNSGVRVSRRVLPKAISFLERVGMLSSIRQGHHLELSLNRTAQ